ncbi:MAG: hypothetical protein R3328_00070 [Planococcaceae bacterium]|nr:hypothetical protein [Planococcaceae bacterium]
MERFFVSLIFVSSLLVSGLIYGYSETKEFNTFVADFEESLAHNGSTQFMNDIYYEQMKKDFVLFKLTSQYKEVENQYLLAVQEEQNFFSTIE